MRMRMRMRNHLQSHRLCFASCLRAQDVYNFISEYIIDLEQEHLQIRGAENNKVLFFSIVKRVVHVYTYLVIPLYRFSTKRSTCTYLLHVNLRREMHMANFK